MSNNDLSKFSIEQLQSEIEKRTAYQQVQDLDLNTIHKPESYQRQAPRRECENCRWFALQRDRDAKMLGDKVYPICGKLIECDALTSPSVRSFLWDRVKALPAPAYASFIESIEVDRQGVCDLHEFDGE